MINGSRLTSLYSSSEAGPVPCSPSWARRCWPVHDAARWRRVVGTLWSERCQAVARCGFWSFVINELTETSYSHTNNILPQSHTWMCDQNKLHCRFTYSLTEHTQMANPFGLCHSHFFNIPLVHQVATIRLCIQVTHNNGNLSLVAQCVTEKLGQILDWMLWMKSLVRFCDWMLWRMSIYFNPSSFLA